MPTEPVENSWVIIEKELLLQNVNGTVFAPQGFQEYKSLAVHTGVVPFSKVRDCFKEKEETKYIDTELIIQFMIHMEFCGEILDNRMLELLAITYPDHKSDRHFLFPNLITENRERVECANSGESVWQPNPHITYSPYSLCWALQCHEEQHYLSPRFLQVLLLRLAFQHALPADPRKAASAIPGHKQACTLWQSGIKWNTTSLTEVLVEVSDHQVAVTMRCNEGKEIALIRTRSQVIKEVLSVKKEFCDNTETVEMFIPNPQYPLKYDLSVSVENVAYSVAHHEEAALASNLVHTPVELKKLLCFEPYMCLSSDCLISLYSPDSHSHSVTPQFIDHAARAIVKHHDFCKVFDDFCTVLDVLSHEISVDDCSSAYSKVERMFLVWKKRTQGTYQSLRDHLDKYSVFSGRNVLEVAPFTHTTPGPFSKPGEQDNQSSATAASPIANPEPVVLSAAPTTKQGTPSSSIETSPHAQPQSASPSSENSTTSTTNECSQFPPATGGSPRVPSLPELICFKGRERDINIPQEVGIKYKEFGILLLNDQRGNQVENIASQCHYRPEKINMDILQAWLNGRGLPATWRTLVDTLKFISLNELAKDIQDVKLLY